MCVVVVAMAAEPPRKCVSSTIAGGVSLPSHSRRQASKCRGLRRGPVFAPGREAFNGVTFP